MLRHTGETNRLRAGALCLSVAACTAGFAAARPAGADVATIEVVSALEPFGDGAAAVHRVYARVLQPGLRLASVAGVMPVVGNATFFHNDAATGFTDATAFGSWSATHAADAAAVDSFVLAGGDAGAASDGRTSPDHCWGAPGFASAQPDFRGTTTPGLGWFPTDGLASPQTAPDAAGRVLIAQFVTDPAAAVTFRARIECGRLGDAARFAETHFFTLTLDGPADECADDPSKVTAGQCGCGAPETDSDGDGASDCVDTGVVRVETLAWLPAKGFTPVAMGEAIAADGGVAVVGARQSLLAGQATPGAAVVLERTAKGWRSAQVLRAVNPRFGERFGSSVAVSGTRLAVGAPDRAPCGAVTLFRRAKSSWVVEQVIAPTAGGRFGGAIALDGSRLAVGSTWDFGISGPESGSVAIYDLDEDGLYTRVATLADDTPYSQHFGSAVALHGDLLVVGTPSSLQGTGPLGGGSASVFRRNAATGAWTLEQELWPPQAYASELFGTAVAIQGDTVVVGAPRAFGADGDRIGAAHVFLRDAQGAWQHDAALVPPDRVAPLAITGEIGFGRTLALRGALLAVGAPDRIDAATGSDGATYLFRRDSTRRWTPATLAASADTTAAGVLRGTGSALALAGDELLVGAPRSAGPKGSASPAGAVEVLRVRDEPSADFTGDGHVDARDIAVLLSAWGTADPVADLTRDGVVGPQDMAMLLSQWG